MIYLKSLSMGYKYENFLSNSKFFIYRIIKLKELIYQFLYFTFSIQILILSPILG